MGQLHDVAADVVHALLEMLLEPIEISGLPRTPPLPMRAQVVHANLDGPLLGVVGVLQQMVRSGFAVLVLHGPDGRRGILHDEAQVVSVLAAEIPFDLELLLPSGRLLLGG